MEGHRQLDHAQAGRKMSAMDTHRIDNVLPELVTQLLQLFPTQLLEIGWGIDCLEQGARGNFHS
jgi:hypothetical protein